MFAAEPLDLWADDAGLGEQFVRVLPEAGRLSTYRARLLLDTGCGPGPVP